MSEIPFNLEETETVDTVIENITEQEEVAKPRKKRGPVSDETKARMSEAKRKYWKRVHEQEEKEEEPYIPSETDIQANAFLGSTLWILLAPLTKCRPLSEDESKQLGTAMAPVLHKYLPLYERFAAEINLCVVVLGLYQNTKIVEQKSNATTEETKPNR